MKFLKLLISPSRYLAIGILLGSQPILSAEVSSPSVTASSFIENQCSGCHQPFDESPVESDLIHHESEKNCVKCHVKLADAHSANPFANKRSVDFMQERQTYLLAPELTMLYQSKYGVIPKYTKSGLIQFLEEPVSRHPKSGYSMFPLNKVLLDNFKSTLNKSNSTAVPDFIEDDHLLSNGKILYDRLGCVGCHSAHASNVPVLRIGVPLLSFQFFKTTVKWGTSNQVGTMPKFNLSDKQVKALFAYVSTSTKDIASPSNSKLRRERFKIGRRLYREVVNKVLGKSCRHCHSSSKSVQQTISNVFASTGANGFSLYRDLQGNLQVTQESGPSLQTGPNCKPSILVNRLRERQNEWHGTGDASVIGMPMTVSPVSPKLIDKVHLWSSLGCPTNSGNLCIPCSG